MKILQLSSYNLLGGAAIAANRLHIGLRGAGVASSMWVRRRFGETPAIECADDPWSKFAMRIRRRCELWRARQAGWRGTGMFSPGWAGASLQGVLARHAPDLVHLHWVNDGFVAVRELARLKVPVVWTLHDMWPFTGGCHYAGDCRRFEDHCGACPLLGARKEDDLSRRMLKEKNHAYRALTLVPVAPSAWLAGVARTSTPFRSRDVRVIPYGMDLEQFRPGAAADARALLGLPTEGSWIIAGASRFREDPRKGFDLFREIVHAIGNSRQRGIRFAVFGTGKRGVVDCEGVSLIELGSIPDEATMTTVYQAADVFVAPSREDNLPNTLLEATACGTPCAGFRIGGVPEIIDDGVSGCLAAPFDAVSLAGKIETLLADRDHLRRARDATRAIAQSRFSVAGMVSSYTRLYRELLSSR